MNESCGFQWIRSYPLQGVDFLVKFKRIIVVEVPKSQVSSCSQLDLLRFFRLLE